MSKINLVAEMLQTHSDPEIIEYLYRAMQAVDKYYDAAIANGMDANLLFTQTETISQATDILKALYKRDQARLAQSQAK